DAYTYKVAASLEKALQLKGGVGSTRQHVHGCSLVRARRFYGYHSFEELFAGAVLDKCLQPHESHIPYILQFLVDYNLYGMGHLHLTKMKFRHPIPDSSHKKSSIYSKHIMADSGADVCLESKMWISSTVPSDWMWSPAGEFGASSNDKPYCPKRQSTSELEGDASVDEILNQQFIMYSSLSQTCSDVKMVQSLVPIWEEQQKRTGINEASMPPDPGKPLPEDVMKLLSAGLYFEKRLLELCNEAGTTVSSTPSETPSQKVLRFAAEWEAQHLLKWLATSQAAEDINSDDDLACETMLSPLLPAATIDKMVEKASMQYESESQKECQDILDSVDDMLELKFSKQKPSCSIDHSDPIEVSTKITLPQVDGSADDDYSIPCASLAETSSAAERNSESRRPSEYHVLHSTDTAVVSKDKRSKQWGSLPFSVADKVKCSGDQATLQVTCPFESQSEDSTDSDNGFRKSTCITRNVDRTVSESKEQRFVNCSLRDLMRRKRSFRVEQTEYDSGTSKKLLLDRREGPNTCHWKKQLDLKAIQTNEEETKPLKNCDLKLSSRDSLVCQKLPLPDGKDSFLQADMQRDECFSENENGAPEASELLRTSENQGSLVYMPNPCPDVQLLRTDTDHKIIAPESCQQTYSAASSSVQNSSIDDKVSCKHNYMDQDSRGSISFAQQVLLNERVDNKKHGVDLLGEKTIVSESIDDDLKDKRMKLTEVSVAKETPLTDKNLENLLPLPTMSDSNSHLDEESCDEMSDVFLPISIKDSQKEMESWNKCVTIKAPRSHGKKDIAIHYQNDGSPLYLLTPNILPPSVTSVQRWLSLDERDHTSQETDVVAKDVPEHTSGLTLQPKLYDDSSAEKKPPCNNGGQTETVKVSPDGSQDNSQISGPMRRSNSTPLSQIGFRDPASVGCGQQLTLLSIEVLAESRADLLPDPQFDAINIVVLGFQNDCDSIVEVLVLLHNKFQPCQRSFDGLAGCKLLVFSDEKHLLKEFINIVSSSDPDILMGWDIQGYSLGFLAERASHFGLGLINRLSRTPSDSWVASEDVKASEKGILELDDPDTPSIDCCVQESSIIEDEWGRTHASGVHVGGRIVLNVWRLIRGEVKLNLYSVEAVAEAVLRRKIPFIHNKVLTRWFSSGPGRARYQCIKYVVERAKLNFEILNQLDMVNRTSELARVFGIDFFSVLSRGSQYRVESMLLRLAHTQNYLVISPGKQQVASQPAMECLPLVMEPESGFYSDPVVVFDFQSLYPSMIIAYNLCFCTCLGKVVASKDNTLGVSSFSPEQHVLQYLKDQILLTPNGVMFVPSKVCRGVLPRLLEEILSTRIMVKQAIKKLVPSEQVLQRIFNARQLALKLISNVTYGYTAAGFSGRMPCAELADSIVQCGRSTLERAISFVNLHEKWNARVIYGDTDSMFVLLKGRTIKESFQIGSEIASAITAMNPSPVTLKMEKVYQPCFLLTKKRYVGYSYESPEQIEPVFDAKGIETVRRDTCGAVAKIMEQSLRLFFQHQDLLEVKCYLQRQWKRILSGRFSLKDFVFAKEVRLGTYSGRISSLPPAAIVATKAMRSDRRAEPRYAERIPYVVIHGEPGARLSDMVVDPLEVLAIDSPFRINDLYYINKQIIPALQRVFGLVGADLIQWFLEMPRPIREASVKNKFSSNFQRTRIDYYYLSKHCIVCGELVQASARFCSRCSENEVAAATAVISKTSKLEREMQHLVAICHHCGGGDSLLESGVKCTSIACEVFYERRKVQKELLAATDVAAEKGFYPKCTVEWF
ncbi:hypothetical protein PIB30_018351, partial [Stylosanthes scabra]|nr:hypothetical protein [Stylosanthes scabra]